MFVAREQLAADHLRIRLEQAEAVAVPVARQRIEPEIGIGRFELHVAAEQLPGRSHRRIADVVADAGQGAEAHQRSFALLVAAGKNLHVVEIRIIRRQPHLRPDFQERAWDRLATDAAAGHVLLVGRVVEQIEFDQLHALVFEVHQRAVDAARVAVDQMPQQRRYRQ